MFSTHLFKVIASFCGVILFGLISLVIIDSLKNKEATALQNTPTVKTTNSITLPAVKSTEPPAKPAAKKTQ
jgi:hypothetical protein